MQTQEEKLRKFVSLAMRLSEGKIALREAERRLEHAESRLWFVDFEQLGKLADGAKRGAPRKWRRDLGIVQAIWELLKGGYCKSAAAAISIVAEELELDDKMIEYRIWRPFRRWQDYQFQRTTVLAFWIERWRNTQDRGALQMVATISCLTH